MNASFYNTIIGRLIIVFGVFIILLIGIYVVTDATSKNQKDDGLIVNLSGRQRMLTQKMSKEALIYNTVSKRPGQEGLGKAKDQLKATMKVFETTLFALRDGGSAPLNLEMTRFRQSPPAATVEIKRQLDKVVNLWSSFKKNLTKLIDSKGADMASLEYIIKNNVDLLKEMNKVVFLMQYDAEDKVGRISWTNMSAILIGILIVLGSLIIAKKSVTDPLKHFNEVSREISMGNLSQKITISGGLSEISQLGESLNRMRTSLMIKLEE